VIVPQFRFTFRRETAGLIEFFYSGYKKRIQIFLIVAVMGGFVVTECGRRKSKFLDIEMVFLIGPRV